MAESDYQEYMQKMGSARVRKVTRLLMALALLIAGIIAIVSYEFFLSVILNAALLTAFVNGIFKILGAIHSRDKADFIFGLLSIGFGCALLFYSFLPEWIIRVCFGIYALMTATSLLIQQGIYLYNNTRTSISGWIFSCLYCMLGFLLLFSPMVTTSFLMKLFGWYFLLLAARYLVDAFYVDSPKYKWRRTFHVSPPTLLATLIPDIYLSRINEHFDSGKPLETVQFKRDEEPLLKAMVHIGPEGFQKVGHFSFAYKGIVYSYGNYDTESGKLFGLLGDGVFFKVPFETYLPNIMKYEHNTIFEYGIHITPEQEALLDAEIARLDNNAFRWYSRLEKEDGMSHFQDYESDYPCRLHYRTGAKFYKIKSGRFRTYWVTGENCVMFADQILGVIGADVLSVRGIITPGAYFDYLQSEYEKEGSPVVKCVIHPYRALGTGQE